MKKSILIAAAFFGLIAVAFGAFGAHGLKKIVSPEYIVMWEKGVQYQFYHALALMVCALYLKTEYTKLVLNAAYCFIFGILFFSGSLYLLATRELTGVPTVILGPITPIGGFFFIVGWGLILVHALKKD